MPTPLQNKLIGLRNKVRFQHGAAGLARLVVLVSGLVAITYLLDRSLHLPFGVRTVLLGLSAGIVLAAAARALILPLRRPLQDLDLAAGVEATYPDLKDRLRSALDFERALADGTFPESRELAGRVVAETLDQVKPLNVLRVARNRRLVPWAAAGLATVLLLGAGFSMGPEHARVWFRRCVLLSQGVTWPRTTTLRVLMPPRGSPVYVTREHGATVFHLAQGLDFTVNVVADRGNPAEVSLHFDPLPDESRSPTGSRVLPRVQTARYATTFERLTRSFAFHVTGGDDDDRDPRYQVRVHAAPAVASVAVRAVFPPYTGRTPRTFETGDVDVPRHTELTLTMESTQPLRSAALLVDQQPPKPIERVAPGRYRTTLRADQDFDYAFDLVSESQIQNHHRVRFRVTTVPDRAPSIRVARPGGTLVDVTPDAVVPLLALVRDDYGARACRLLVQRGDKRHTLSLEGEDRIGGDDGDVQGTRAFYVFRHLPLTELVADPAHKPSVGEVLRLIVEVEDNHQDPGGHDQPHTTRTREIKLELLRPGDLERRINDRQLRVKEDVRKAHAYQEKTLADAEDLAASFDPATAASPKARNVDLKAVAEQILTLEQRQNRITSDLRNILGDLEENLDAFVYNRLEDNQVTDRVLDLFVRETRRQPHDDQARFRNLVAASGQDSIGNSDVLGKLVTMTGLALDAAEEASPTAGRTLHDARAAGGIEVVRKFLGEAIRRQVRVRDVLAALLDGLEDWEDYQEVIQLNKELIELQKEIESRTINLLERALKPEENRSR